MDFGWGLGYVYGEKKIMASETVVKRRVEVIDAAEAERRIRAGEVDESLEEWMPREIDASLARIDVLLAAQRVNTNELKKRLAERAV